MADTEQYPTGVNPQLIKEGEIDDGTQVDNDLKQAETEEHIGYIRKVLGIVAFQMTFTFLLCVLSTNFQKIGDFFKHPATIIFALILLITCVCFIALSEKYRRQVPLNYFLLAGATLGETCFLAATAADLKEFSVYTAILGTCLAVAGLFAGAMYTSSSMNREDLIKNMVKYAIIALVLDFIMLIVIIFLYHPKDAAIVTAISLVMLVIVSGYVIFDLLFIIVPGIEDKEDYILGALRLYLDIARLFFWMMKLLGEKKK